MIDIKLDSTSHDTVIVNHDLTLITDLDALVQSIKIRLKTFFAEWILDTRIGVRYFEDILVKNPNLTQVEALLKSEILNTPNVNSLLSFASNYDPVARTLSVSFSCDSVFGPITMTNFGLGV
jgi:hypothetical protein